MGPDNADHALQLYQDRRLGHHGERQLFEGAPNDGRQQHLAGDGLVETLTQAETMFDKDVRGRDK